MDTKIASTINKISAEMSAPAMNISLQSSKTLPSGEVLEQIVKTLKRIMFPSFFGGDIISSAMLTSHLSIDIESVVNNLSAEIDRAICFSGCEKGCDGIAMALSFIENIPSVKSSILTDIEAMYDADPAATSHGEILLCYPSITAMIHYRIAHELQLLGVPILPRVITEMAHSMTGIDIHPAATIGDYFAIDHGTGVVIGETCIIGSRVRLYQGVTLGARSFTLDESGNPINTPRHPIIEDNVTIYSNASILGRITIGEGSTIGGNVWVTSNVPAGSKVSQSSKMF